MNIIFYKDLRRIELCGKIKPEEFIMIEKLKAILSALNKSTVIALVVVMLAGISLNSYIYDDSIQVHINVDGITVKTVNTKAATVGDILVKENIILEQGDVVSPSEDTKLISSDTISVKKLKSITVYNGESTYDVKTSATTALELEKSGAVGLMPTDSVIAPKGRLADGGSYDVKNAYLINVYADGSIYPVYLSKGTVSDAIAKAGLVLDADDFSSPSADTALWDGIEIKVTRVSTVYTTEKEEIPFETEWIENEYLKPAEKVVTVEGVAGERVINKVITYHDGTAVEETATVTNVRPAVNQVVECGKCALKSSRLNYAAAVGSVNGHEYSMVIRATATAYCDKGTTASGLRSQVGVVAVDPRVIPLGTRLYIESSDGSWSYGVCVAGDTGGAIKGNIVDLFYDSYNECIQFGRRGCNIYVLAD